MLTQKLADFVINTSVSDLPREAIDCARDALIDTIGCGLAGTPEEACRIVVRFLRDQGGNAQATVWGVGLATTVSDAAFANGVFSHALDFDDTHSNVHGHPSATLVSAIVATGEYAHASVFRQGAGGPTPRAVVGKPVVRQVVVHVIRVEERDEQVDVEQRDPAHLASRRSLTSFIVGRRAPDGRGGSSGTPLRDWTVRAGASAFRTSSDTILPAVVPREAANSLAASSTSSSRSSVVRMLSASRISHQMSR